MDERRKFKEFWCSAKAVRQLNDTICFENGYSIVENPKNKGKTYDKWLSSKEKPCHRERICAAIDEAMAQNPASFETLLELLKQAGYTVNSGKVPSVLGGEQKNHIRMDALGENYTPEVLRAVIKGQRTHTPKKRRSTISQDKKIQLAVDFESAVHSGKGPGFEKWAKLFNMKQGSKAVAYLQEHGLTSYADLEALNDELTHKAAKKYFDDKGMDIIPKTQDLKAEHITLVQKRTAINAQYRKAKAEKEELSIVKANIDAILKEDHHKTATQER